MMEVGEITQKEISNLANKKLLYLYVQAIVNIQSSKNSEWGFTETQREFRKSYKRDAEYFERELLKRMGDNNE